MRSRGAAEGRHPEPTPPAHASLRPGAPGEPPGTVMASVDGRVEIAGVGGTLVIGRGQPYSVKHKARAILSGEALPVAVNTGLAAGFKLPADYDGEQYEVIADGEPNGGWFLSRSAARAHATALSAQGYDTVSVRRVSLAD